MSRCKDCGVVILPGDDASRHEHDGRVFFGYEAPRPAQLLASRVDDYRVPPPPGGIGEAAAIMLGMLIGAIVATAVWALYAFQHPGCL
jgi:hypothetical protein